MESFQSLPPLKRLIALFFGLVGLGIVLLAFLGNQALGPGLKTLTVGFVVLAVALNPQNYRGGIVFRWKAQPAKCKWLFLAAFACFGASGLIGVSSHFLAK